MSPYELFAAPFADYAFMRRALAGCVALSTGAAPVGVFLMLRRMSLAGDAMAHAILPGTAAALLFGLKVIPMTIGGMAAGLIVALSAGAVARTTTLKEDASLAAFYLIALALGVLIISLKGSSVDLMHILFGSVLALDDQALLFLGGAATFSLLLLALICARFDHRVRRSRLPKRHLGPGRDRTRRLPGAPRPQSRGPLFRRWVRCSPSAL